MTVLPDNNSDEQLDVLDAAGNVIGRADRAEVHAKGLWHRTFHCLVVRSIPAGAGNSPVSVVLQRRSRQSRTFPGLIDLTASGHLMAGEQPRDGVRELAEEAGLVADVDQLIPLGVQVIVDERPGRLNREHVHVFLLVDNTPLAAFNPNKAEVDGLVEAPTADLLELFHRQRIGETAFAIPVREVAAEAGEPFSSTLTPEDLIPGSHNYFVKALIMAERHVRGQHPIAI